MSENARKKRRMQRYYLKVQLLVEDNYVPAEIRPSPQHLEREGMWVYIRASDGLTVFVPTDPWHVTPYTLAMTKGTHNECIAEELKASLNRLLGDLVKVEIHTI